MTFIIYTSIFFVAFFVFLFISFTSFLLLSTPENTIMLVKEDRKNLIISICLGLVGTFIIVNTIVAGLFYDTLEKVEIIAPAAISVKETTEEE